MAEPKVLAGSKTKRQAAPAELPLIPEKRTPQAVFDHVMARFPKTMARLAE